MAREPSKFSNNSQAGSLPICGIIRPISPVGIYTPEHWIAVADILDDAIREAGYQARLVSEEAAVGVIHTSIVRNLYYDPIVVCDVSGHNPNVMFELGMRIAFQKPVVIVVDDETKFSFDINAIRHIVYPRSLRFPDIVKFKSDLKIAVEATVAATASSEYRGYLQSYGNIEVTEIGSRKVSPDEIASTLFDLRDEMADLRRIISLRAPGSALSQNIAPRYTGVYFQCQQNTERMLIDVVSNISGIQIADVKIVDPSVEGDLTQVQIKFAHSPTVREIRILEAELQKNGAEMFVTLSSKIIPPI
jgi:hypothetical protein